MTRRGFYKSAMFGFSVTKLLLLAAIIAGVWYGFKMIGRLDSARKSEAKLRARQAQEKKRAPERGRREARRSDPDAEEMVQCPACLAYVPTVNTRNCGRPDCPY